MDNDLPATTPEFTPARRWIRYSLDLSLRVRVPTPSGFEYMLSHARDLNQGGMAVYVPAEMEVGDTVLLEIIFPGLQEPLAISACIKDRMGFKYGVEFVNPTPEQQQIILTNVHRLLALAQSA